MSDERTAAAVPAEKQHELDVRVTGLERDMQNMSHAVTHLSASVERGFAETRQMFEDAEKRHHLGLEDVRTRVDQSAVEHAQSRQWNPGLVLAAITCSILVGGIFVAFVNMTYNSAEQNILEDRRAMQQHRDDTRRELDAMVDHNIRRDLLYLELLERVAKLESAEECRARSESNHE